MDYSESVIDSGAAAAVSGQPEHVSDPSSTAGAQVVELRVQSHGSVQSPGPNSAPIPIVDPTAPSAKWIGLGGLAVVVGSLAVTYFGTFFVGLLCLAAMFAAIGFMRATLPRPTMAWFASRHRAIDSTFYIGFAILVLALAIGIPQ